jgi:ribosome assembly protein 4
MGVNSLAVSPDGMRLAFGGYQSIRLWDVGKGEELGELKGHTDFVLCLAFSPDGKRLISGGADQTLRLWDVEQRKQLAGKEGKQGHASQVVSVAWSPDGKHVLSGGTGTKGLPGEKRDVTERRTLRIWEVMPPDPQTGDVYMHEPQLFEVPVGAIRTVAFSADGKQALSAGDDPRIRLWRVGR